MNLWNKTRDFMIRMSGQLGLDVRYFIKGGFWLSLPFLVNNLLGILRSILFARLLTKDVYGQFGFVNDTIGTLAFLTLPGLGSALVETVARGNHGAILDAAHARIRWSLLLSLGTLGFGFYYLWDGQPTIALALWVGGILQPMAATFGLIQSYYTGRKHFDKVSYLNIGQSLSNTGTIILMLLLDKGLVWLIAANYGSNLIFYGFFYYLTISHLKDEPRDPDVIPYGRSLTWADLILSLSNSLDGFILGITAGFTDVAVYRVAAALPKGVKSPIQSLRPLVMPKIAEKPDKQIYTSRVRKQLLLLVLLNLLFVGIFMVLMPFLLPMIYGETYREAVLYAQLLMLSLSFGWPDSFFLAALQARKQTHAIARGNLVFGILLIGTMILLTPVMGIMGIVVSRLLARWGGTLYRWREVSRL